MRARSNENLWVFDLRVFASCIHRHRRLGSDPTRRKRRARATRASGCKPEFSHQGMPQA